MAPQFLTCFLISSLMLLQACGRPGTSSDNDPARAGAPVAQMLAQAGANQVAGAPGGAARDPSAPGMTTASFWAAQKLIRSADIGIEVTSVQSAMRLADSLVRRHGALLADSKLSQDANGRRQAELDIRVPSDSFAKTIVALRQLGDVRSEEVSTQNITKEYTDLETRLAVKEQEVARLRSLLDNRTAKLTDVLDVERELTRAITELEEMKGEQRYYDQQIALSSITLTLTDRTASSSAQVSRPIQSALRSSLGVLGTSLSGMIYLIAIVLPWAILAILIWWVATRLRARIHRSRG